MKITLKPETQGNYEFKFAIGSSKNLFKSEFAEVFVTICGKEKLSLTGSVDEVIKYIWPAQD